MDLFGVVVAAVWYVTVGVTDVYGGSCCAYCGSGYEYYAVGDDCVCDDRTR